MKIISWNMQNKRESWRFLFERHGDVDFAFIQEACTPTRYVRRQASSWDIPYERWDVVPKRYKPEVLRVGDGWRMDRLCRDTISGYAPRGERIIVPRWRAAAVVRRPGREPICLVSIATGSVQSRRLANTVLAIRRTLRRAKLNPQMAMIVAGDLTTNPTRTPETFSAMQEIEMHHLGPHEPNYIQVIGRRADRRETSETAHRHLNHVFVTKDLKERVTVTALNDPDPDSAAYWGPSDHCRILIEVE